MLFPAGQLLRLDAYLHERTDGMIGGLSHFIRVGWLRGIRRPSPVSLPEVFESQRRLGFPLPRPVAPARPATKAPVQ
jgi:hypothetical protein